MGTSRGQAQPANDLFANRIVLIGTNIAVTGSSVGATRETDEPFHANDTGGASVWWSWTAPMNGAATISLAGSSFDTVLAVYTGASVSTLSSIGSNDDEDYSAGICTSKLVVDVQADRTYQIVVEGYARESGSIELSLVLGPPTPLPLAPSWVAPDPNGVNVSSSSCADKVVILDFWATWCGPCKAEMPDLVALQEKYRADGLVIVGADADWSGDTAAAVQSFLATWTPAINYQTVMANSAMMQAYGGIDAIPTTFVIDRQNIIRKRFVGAQSRSVLEQAICPLLFGRLSCQRTGSDLTLRWGTNAGSCTLESTTNLINPNWSGWPNPPTVANGTNHAVVRPSGSPQYFRLRMPY